VIFCLTELHTGTNSVLAWLGQHSDCDGVLLSTEVLEPGHPKCTVYHEHIRPDYRFDQEMCRTQIVMAWTHPTLITIRDPLASLVSYQHRAERDGRKGTIEFQPIDHVVDRWCLLARSEDRFSESLNVRYLALDLFEPPGKTELWDTAQALGLKDDRPSMEGLPVENNSGEYYLKRLYADGHFDRLEIHLKGLDYLVDCQGILRPFLERRGYSNLLWWDR